MTELKLKKLTELDKKIIYTCVGKRPKGVSFDLMAEWLIEYYGLPKEEIFSSWNDIRLSGFKANTSLLPTALVNFFKVKSDDLNDPTRTPYNKIEVKRNKINKEESSSDLELLRRENAELKEKIGKLELELQANKVLGDKLSFQF